MRPSRHPNYQRWRRMIARCDHRCDVKYPIYGGRGIQVCPEWYDFNTFNNDMGVCPQRMTLERVDNDGGYNKGNCKWATPWEQARNRVDNLYITLNGDTKLAIDWADELSIPRNMVHKRLAKGYPPELTLHPDYLWKKEAKELLAKHGYYSSGHGVYKL